MEKKLKTPQIVREDTIFSTVQIEQNQFVDIGVDRTVGPAIVLSDLQVTTNNGIIQQQKQEISS